MNGRILLDTKLLGPNLITSELGRCRITVVYLAISRLIKVSVPLKKSCPKRSYDTAGYQRIFHHAQLAQSEFIEHLCFSNFVAHWVHRTLRIMPIPAVG